MLDPSLVNGSFVRLTDQIFFADLDGMTILAVGYTVLHEVLDALGVGFLQLGLECRSRLFIFLPSVLEAAALDGLFN